MDHVEPGSFHEKRSSGMLARSVFGEPSRESVAPLWEPRLVTGFRNNRACYAVAFYNAGRWHSVFDGSEIRAVWIWPLLPEGD